MSENPPIREPIRGALAALAAGDIPGAVERLATATPESVSDLALALAHGDDAQARGAAKLAGMLPPALLRLLGEPLALCLGAERPLAVRAQAAATLARAPQRSVPGSACVAVLRELLDQEDASDELCLTALNALVLLEPPAEELEPRLTSLLEREALRVPAARALLLLGRDATGSTLELLLAAAKGADAEQRWLALEAFAQRPELLAQHEGVLEALRGAAAADEPAMRVLALQTFADAAGTLGDAAVAPVAAGLDDPEEQVRERAWLALCRLGPAAIEPMVARLVAAPSEEEAHDLLEALEDIGSDALPALRAALPRLPHARAEAETLARRLGGAAEPGSAPSGGRTTGPPTVGVAVAVVLGALILGLIAWLARS